MATHPIQRRYLAEDLMRLRRADEQLRTASAQRQGRVDPNPHQIDAVIFALRRLPEGGCILADEVGLGKTIEAGLVLAQRRAEGDRRILIIVPKPLLGQWQEELRALFGIEAREVTLDPASVAGDHIFIVGRELAGGARGAAMLATSGRFDLCVIDEAHEIFAGIHKRFDASGEARLDSGEAQMAMRVRSFLGTTPVLLLTATPIQNSLAELWGLVQYIEPTGTLLGDLRTFRSLFCDGDDRKLLPGQEHELRRRLATICQRTLRRQAQEFLEQPFVGRRCLLLEYSMEPGEKALYDDVTEYLLEPSLCAFTGRSRQLQLIAFHRLMGSSVRALAKALDNVAARLRGFLEGAPITGGDLPADLDDVDDLELDGDEDAPPPPQASPERIAAELERVQGFIRRAHALPGDSKAGYLVQALRIGEERLRAGQGSGKAVIFTESLATQDYLRESLLAAGWPDGAITRFRGHNDGPRAAEAYERWIDEVGRHLRKRPSRDVAIRAALVHEFRTRSSLFISTEAGAKGLNLQFCDTVVNYDLPWNPQRIEQRIGRCHRYGQEREVTVVNFLAADNEAHRLIHEILGQKLDLFGRVLDASDHVLHEPRSRAPSTAGSALAVELETELRRIHDRARSRDEIAAELRRLRETMEKRRHEHDDRLQATAGLIQSRFDTEVRQVFRRLQDELPLALASLDRGLDRLLTGYLDAIGASFERLEGKDRITYAIAPSARLPESLVDGGRFAVGDAKRLDGHEPIHLAHALVRAAVAEARAATTGRMVVKITLPPGSPSSLNTRRGRRGRLVVAKVTYGGLEPVERLMPVALIEGEPAALPLEHAGALLAMPVEDRAALEPPLALAETDVDDAVEEALFLDQTEVEQVEQESFGRALEQIERYADDRLRVLRQMLEDVRRRLENARRRRDAALAIDARDEAAAGVARLEQDEAQLEARVSRLEARDDPRYQELVAELQRRRFAPVRSERVLDVEMILS